MATVPVGSSFCERQCEQVQDRQTYDWGIKTSRPKMVIGKMWICGMLKVKFGIKNRRNCCGMAGKMWKE